MSNLLRFIFLAVAVAQLFGGEAAQINFTRIPHWCTEVMVVIFFVAMIVDRCSVGSGRAHSVLSIATICARDMGYMDYYSDAYVSICKQES